MICSKARRAQISRQAYGAAAASHAVIAVPVAPLRTGCNTRPLLPRYHHRIQSRANASGPRQFLIFIASFLRRGKIRMRLTSVTVMLGRRSAFRFRSGYRCGERSTKIAQAIPGGGRCREIRCCADLRQTMAIDRGIASPAWAQTKLVPNGVTARAGNCAPIGRTNRLTFSQAITSVTNEPTHCPRRRLHI